MFPGKDPFDVIIGEFTDTRHSEMIYQQQNKNDTYYPEKNKLRNPTTRYKIVIFNS